MWVEAIALVFDRTDDMVLCYYRINLYNLTEMLKEAVLIALATSALTAHSVLAQLPEQTTEEGKGFYTDNCKVTITRNNQKVFEKPCSYFAITIKAQANFHFGFTNWSDNIISFLLPIPEAVKSSVRITPILAFIFVENREVTEFLEGSGNCQEMMDSGYTVSCEFTSSDSSLKVQAFARE